VSEPGLALRGGARPPAGRPLLFRGGTVLTQDPALGDLVGADVLVRGSTIEAVGTDLAAPADAVVLDASEAILLPGFVDGHRHCWQGALRRLAPDADLPRYMSITHDGVARHYRPQDMHVGDLVALLGALDAGFTTVLDLSHNTRSRAHADAVLQAYREVGIRAVHASAPPNAGEWEEHWPRDLHRLRDVVAQEPLISLRMAIDMRRVRPVEELMAIARDLGLGIHIDGVMGAGSSQELTELGRAGLLGPDVSIVHATSLGDSAWEQIAASGAHVVLATTSDEQLGLAGAIPPVQRVVDAGMRPGLSVDVEISLAGDPFTQMRATLLTQRMLATAARMAGGPPSRLLTSAEVLSWATLGGAEACGLGDSVGSLTPGKQADLLVVDPTGANALPGGNPVGQVVHGVDRSDVRVVLVGGAVRKWDGALVDVDLVEVRRLALDSRRHLLAGAGFSLGVGGLEGVPELRDDALRSYLGSHDDHVIDGPVASRPAQQDGDG
jgi:cytosine/adenosine deaminase-related metal-dependent hydrolase